jgi:acyl carrier protein|tara:strand:+ start:322 stop:558 length:237 start_codon:yes stop_codon:yes gene_type:complete
MTNKEKENLLKKILKKVKPNININNSSSASFVNNGDLDSFDIIQIILEIEKINKKKINPNKVGRNTFKNFKSILPLIK